MNELYEMMDRRDRLANRMALQRSLFGIPNRKERGALFAQYNKDKSERDTLVREINSRMESFRNEANSRIN